MQKIYLLLRCSVFCMFGSGSLQDLIASPNTNAMTESFGNSSGNTVVTPSKACDNGTQQTLAVVTALSGNSVNVDMSTAAGFKPLIENVSSPATSLVQAGLNRVIQTLWLWHGRYNINLYPRNINVIGKFYTIY